MIYLNFIYKNKYLKLKYLNLIFINFLKLNIYKILNLFFKIMDKSITKGKKYFYL